MIIWAKKSICDVIVVRLESIQFSSICSDMLKKKLHRFSYKNYGNIQYTV